MEGRLANPLNSLERTNLRRCEKIIENGCKTFVDVGRALAEVRDSELYRETHQSFSGYCKDKWGFTRQRAYQYIKGAEVSTECQQIVDTSSLGSPDAPVLEPALPINEAQARELGRLPKEQQANAWADSLDAAGGEQPTAEQVREVVETYAADNEPYKPPTGTKPAPKPKPGPPIKNLKGAEKEAFDARKQIKVWSDTIGRWLSQSPSIDDYRNKWSGKRSDRVLAAVKELYEALKAWPKGIK